ncbi:glycosyltransferase family 2 protein [Flaviflexus salsibiostraticola]|uniref:Glycosyltransferase family 2 protein n=1 Tax=Flaviflexus salsibiostraticola TaxID=1282737 RepID=A0A3Q8WS73_9ACTO|nr:glycosyltransferase family 2 protein [Flaviflexus salsibiostraticola]AZN29019.1 glycosyltransferase family 2 protein [Flaviflexus salsibiostraticola]
MSLTRLPGRTADGVRSIGALTSASTVRPPEPPASAPLVSVVIPCYNYADYLPGAVTSVLRQSGVRTEVIIVDDCSTDSSLQVARNLAARHPNVHALEHRANRGPVDTFNDGLAAATGEFLVRLDADDLLTPGSLGRAVAVLARVDSIGMVYGHPLHFSGDVLPTPRTMTRAVTLWPGTDWLARRCRDGLNVITSPEVVMRMSVVDMVGGQQPLAHTHDMEMWMRIAAFSDVAYLRGCDQAWHRDHDQSLSARKVDSLVDLAERRAAFDTLFAGIASTLPGATQLRDAANRALDRASIAAARNEIDRGTATPERLEHILSGVRSTSAKTRAEIDSVRRRAECPSRASDLPGISWRRLTHRLHYERSFHTWHRRGEF